MTVSLVEAAQAVGFLIACGAVLRAAMALGGIQQSVSEMKNELPRLRADVNGAMQSLQQLATDRRDLVDRVAKVESWSGVERRKDGKTRDRGENTDGD